MLLPALAVFASAALSAQSFLIIPLGALQETGTKIYSPVGSSPDVDTRLVKLECTGCPFSENSVWVDDIPNSLLLKFEVDSKQPDTLKLNGSPLYPTGRFPAMITAPQIHSDIPVENFHEDKDVYESLRLGFELDITRFPHRETSEPDAYSGMELLVLSFHVLEIQEKFVNKLNAIDLKILKDTKTGALKIHSMGLKPIAQGGSGGKCNSHPIICKIRDALMGAGRAGLRKLKGCHKLRPFHKAPAVKIEPVHVETPVAESKPEPVAQQEHHAHKSFDSHTHHRHHGVGRFLRMMKNIALHFFIPILIGVGAGVMASVLGMLVARLIVVVYRAIRNRKQTAYIVLAQGEAQISENSKTLVNDTLPAYDDTEVEVIVMEKDQSVQ
ncbi:MAG: hypothetical protein M1829_003388 [Trizodia sp. TS-e1964]|nr:MAG: hypothetical protein M1829_003388 [Trizodia sp. TS-e1964]